MTSLYVAIPTHSNTITVETAVSAINLVTLANHQNITQKTVFHSASVISHLRNTIVADFIASGFTHLLMLDADQGIEPELLLRMLRSGHPVMGAIYPRRNYFWDMVDLSRPPADVRELLYRGMRFIGEPLENEQGNVVVANGFIQAKTIGTGVLLLRREAIDKLMASYPELRGQGFPEEDENVQRAANNWGFFNPLVKAADGRNTGEDVGFCKRWTDCGGEIWADVTSLQAHVGRQVFRGNYLEWLRITGAGREG